MGSGRKILIHPYSEPADARLPLSPRAPAPAAPAPCSSAASWTWGWQGYLHTLHRRSELFRETEPPGRKRSLLLEKNKRKLEWWKWNDGLHACFLLLFFFFYITSSMPLQGFLCHLLLKSNLQMSKPQYYSIIALKYEFMLLGKPFFKKENSQKLTAATIISIVHS